MASLGCPSSAWCSLYSKTRSAPAVHDMRRALRSVCAPLSDALAALFAKRGLDRCTRSAPRSSKCGWTRICASLSIGDRLLDDSDLQTDWESETMRNRLIRAANGHSEPTTPAQAEEPRKIAVGRDPFASGLDRHRGKPRILDQIARDGRCPAQILEDREVTHPGCDRRAVRLLQQHPGKSRDVKLAGAANVGIFRDAPGITLMWKSAPF